VLLAAFTLVFLATPAASEERKIKRSDLPAAVQAAVTAQSKGSTVRGFAEERENGQTYYEAELEVSGHSKDVLMDPQGNVVEVEEEVAMDALPSAVREGLQTKAAGGKLVFRSYPLDQAALRAAELSECVSPVTYFPMVSLLFAEQGDWAHGDKPLEGLSKIAAGAGLDQTKFQACLADKAISDRIIARAQEGQDKFGVQSTPTFFINGRKIQGAVPYEDFEKLFKELQP